MRRGFALAAAMLCAAITTATAAEQTWTGKIGDSACGRKHQEAAENQGVMPDRECTEACVRGGSLYVLVVDDKVFELSNQKHPDLAKHAGHTVKLTGELSGKSITVSKVEMVSDKN